MGDKTSSKWWPRPKSKKKLVLFPSRLRSTRYTKYGIPHLLETRKIEALALAVASCSPEPIEHMRLIIGLDYGTSHSGGAWALFDPNDGIDPRKIEITTIRGWSGDQPRDYSASKVSSDITYGNGETYWGFDIPDEEPGLKRLKWTKLLLEPEPKLKDFLTEGTIKETREQLRRDNRTEVDAASDYVACLWKHTKERIIESITQAVFDITEKTIVLTIPALWSPKAKHNSYLVAVKAGLTAPEYSLRIVPEPEAAAIAVLKNKARTFEMGDCFIVCDAGGGTVDLTSYQVKSIEPLNLVECVVGAGGLCGSVFLDLAFERYLRTLLTEEVYDNIIARHKALMMRQFESCIKRQFSSSEEKSYIFDLWGVPPNPIIGNENGSIRLTRDILMPLFDSVCSDVEQLIEEQAEALIKKDLSAKLSNIYAYAGKRLISFQALLLVGGFGGNKYLLERLRQAYPKGTMDIMQPENSLEAVSTGAVLCELLGTGNAVDVHLSRINIGITFSKPFQEGIDAPEDKYLCRYRHIYRAKDQVQWCVLKGDQIKTGEKTVFSFSWVGKVSSDSESTVNINPQLVRSDEDTVSNRRTPGVRDYVTITFNVDRDAFKNVQQEVNANGELFREIKYVMEMRMGPATLQFSCLIGGAVRDSANVIYHSK